MYDGNYDAKALYGYTNSRMTSGASRRPTANRKNVSGESEAVFPRLVHQHLGVIGVAFVKSCSRVLRCAKLAWK